MSNINQYKFDKLPNSEVFITQECYTRLMSILNISGFQIAEHKCILYGKVIGLNKILLTEVNKHNDYVVTGRGSKNPAEHGVYINPNSDIGEELKSKIVANEINSVICDIHTHPSGILQDKDYENYRYLSGMDLSAGKNFSTKLKQTADNILFVMGLVSVDNAKGNSAISFVWYDKNKFYRLGNVSIVEKQGENYVKVCSLKNIDGVEYLETNFNCDESSNSVVSMEI